MPTKRKTTKKKVSWQKIWAKRYKKHRAKLFSVFFITVFAVLMYFGLHYKANWHLILDYISVLKWPVLVLIVLYFGRKRIPIIITELMKKDNVSAKLPGGSSLTFSNNKQEPPSGQTIASAQIEEHAEEVQEGTAAISEPPATPPANDADAYQELTNRLTVSEIQLEFERLWRMIFGTQLEVLLRLKQQTNGLSLLRLDYLFQEHLRRLTSAGQPPLYANAYNWISWLEQYGLVQPENGVYKLTPAGEIFLTYLTNQGLILNIDVKPF
jgi:hypothetical protein